MQCRNALARQHSAAWILEGDIRGCFDNISHEWLLKNLHSFYPVLFVDSRTKHAVVRCGAG